MRRAGPLLAVGLAFLTAACAAKVAAPPAAPTADLEAVFRLGLTVVERDGQPVTVVFPGGIDEQTRVAIMSVRDGVDPQDVPETETDKVPAGYFVLDTRRSTATAPGLGASSARSQSHGLVTCC